jgi:signal transduction histidine kinase
MLPILPVLTLMALAPEASAQEPTRILVLHTYGADTPGRLALDAGLASVLRETTNSKVDIYVETVDPNRFVGERHTQALRAFLKERYADKKIDVIATVYDRALAFAIDRRDPLFPDVPVAALLSRYPQARSERVAVTWSGATFAQTASLALQLQPGTRTFVIVDGVPPAEGSHLLYAEARRQIAAATPRVEIVALQGMPLDAVLSRVRILPADAAVLFIRQTINRGGGPISPFDAVKAIAAAAPVPVYVNADVQVGTGALGGVVVTAQQEARNLASLALQIARNGPRPSEPLKNVPMPVVDGRQLQRWGIDESRLPLGTVVRFREPGLWERYKWHFAAAAAVVVLQSVLIAALIAQSSRRRRIAIELTESERRARAVVEQNRDLAGRLINAQEAERTRIARNLHDDVSQEVAGMSILLSGLKRSLDTAGAEAPTEATVIDLQQRAMRVGKAVRHLSHELHPGVLTHAGLAAALTQHCAEVSGHHGLAVSLNTDADLEGLDLEDALCLYRVAQEGLTNVVRHAAAQRAQVTLRRTPTGVELRIADDGVGFDASARMRNGLGLRSIDERIRLARGKTAVESAPGHGTTIIVEVPFTATANVDRAPDSRNSRQDAASIAPSGDQSIASTSASAHVPSNRPSLGM